MANNLFISYDLNKQGKNYDAVFEAIKKLGNWAKLQKSYWYVNSQYTADQVATAVWAVMDNDDSLVVVNSSNNSASWRGVIPAECQKLMKEQWEK